jgi:hypothetical protein
MLSGAARVSRSRPLRLRQAEKASPLSVGRGGGFLEMGAATWPACCSVGGVAQAPLPSADTGERESDAEHLRRQGMGGWSGEGTWQPQSGGRRGLSGAAGSTALRCSLQQYLDNPTMEQVWINGRLTHR